MKSRDEIIKRLSYLGNAVGLEEVIDKGIKESEHNEIAKLLRKGLGIVSFNILEDFIIKRTKEALNEVSQSKIPFDHLPESLQRGAIEGALKALSAKAEVEKKNGGDWRALIQNESAKIHSTYKREGFELSEFSLLPTSSNLSHQNVSDILRAFGVKDAWNQLNVVSNQIGGGVPSLLDAFRNAAARRHAAAHQAGFDYDHSDLSGLKAELLAIAASFDIALECKIRSIALDPGRVVDEGDLDVINVVFLEFDGTVYRQTREIRGKSYKNWTSLADAERRICPGLRQGSKFLVVLSRSKRIDRWYV